MRHAQAATTLTPTALGDESLSLGSFRWRGPDPELAPFWTATGLESVRRAADSLGR